jgi:hypothetical protein
LFPAVNQYEVTHNKNEGKELSLLDERRCCKAPGDVQFCTLHDSCLSSIIGKKAWKRETDKDGTYEIHEGQVCANSGRRE